MRIDFSLFLVSLIAALIGLLLEDITSIGLLWLSVIKYVPLLALYIKYFRKDFSSFVPILFIFFLFALSFLGGHYSMAGLLVTAMLPVVLFVYTKITFTRKQVSIIFLFTLLTLLLYSILSFSGRFSINPNQVSFRILILTVILFFCLYTNSRKRFVCYSWRGKKRVLGPPGLFLLIGVPFLLILLTGCRNSLLVYLLLMVAFVFRNRVAKWNIWGLMLFGLLVLFVVYPFVYCLLSTGFASSVDTEMMGQDIFSGREIIWTYIFAQLTDPSAFFWGNIDTTWWNKSMHNSALDIVVRYGAPAMVVVELIVYYYFKKICKIINNKYKPLLLLVLTTMVWGLNESGMFLGFSFFLFLPYCLLHSKNQQVKQG